MIVKAPVARSPELNSELDFFLNSTLPAPAGRNCEQSNELNQVVKEQSVESFQPSKKIKRSKTKRLEHAGESIHSYKQRRFLNTARRAKPSLTCTTRCCTLSYAALLSPSSILRKREKGKDGSQFMNLQPRKKNNALHLLFHNPFFSSERRLSLMKQPLSFTMSGNREPTTGCETPILYVRLFGAFASQTPS